MNSKSSPLAGAAAGVVLGFAGAVAAYATLVEPAWVEVTHHKLPVNHIPPEWDGARIAHLSDLHYGNPRSHRLIHDAVQVVNDFEPDLVVITGDFLVDRPEQVGPCLELLARVRSRHGIVAVMGDHDTWRDVRYQRACRPGGKLGPKVIVPVPGFLDGLRSYGIRLLRNDAVELPGGFLIAGVEPRTARVQWDDLDLALNRCGGRTPHLLLSHAPDLIVDASRHGVPLMLAGHTHGGQVVIPGYGPPVTHCHLHRRHAAGWSEMDGTKLFTIRGLSSHYSLRFLCRPEIALHVARERS